MIRYVGPLLLVLCGCEAKFEHKSEPAQPIVIVGKGQVEGEDLPDDFYNAKTGKLGLTYKDLVHRCTLEELEIWSKYDAETKKNFVPYAENLPMSDMEASLAVKLKEEGHIDTMFMEWDHESKAGLKVRIQPCYMDTDENKWLYRTQNVWEEVTDPEELAKLKDHYGK